MTAALTEKIHEFKGEMLTDTHVKAIDAEKQYVVDKRNEKYYYDNLVWAADLITFYDILALGNLKPGIKRNFGKSKEMIDQGKPGESIFSLCLEVDLPTAYFGHISNGHFFYTQSKEGLGGIHRSVLSEMLRKWDAIDKATVFSWLDSFLKYNTFEISIPALRDPNLAPEGKTGLMVSILIEYELFDKLNQIGWDKEFRDEIENRIIKILSDTIYPGLQDKVEKQFSVTPLSIKDKVGSTGGAIVGWSFESPIPVVHKMQSVSKSVITPIPNIYQAGQWAYNPAGVPMCIMTGKLAADKISK